MTNSIEIKFVSINVQILLLQSEFFKGKEQK